MAAKKSKHMTGVAFSTQVCDAIRHHIGERKALDSKRTIAFEDRDAALSEKHDIEDHDSDEYLEACKRHSDAIAAIDDLSNSIKWHRNQVDMLVDKADEPQLDFMYEPPAEPAAKDPKQLKLAGEADTRPVGRPGKPKPEAPDPSKGDGVDEHLKASVAELDCRENIKGMLVKAGLTTIGRLAAVADDEKRDLGEIVACDTSMVIDIRRALKAYRTKHRKAAREAEGIAS
ncbi:MAG: hypothetical protein ACKVW3_13120 [Phycisphaerales bacterium]